MIWENGSEGLSVSTETHTLYEINKDIDNLVDLKEEISQVIAGVEQTDLRMILEKRYLCFHSWEKIASEMFYDLRWLHRLHGRALESAGKVYDKIHSDH